MDEKSVLPGLIGGRYLLESKIAHGGMAVVWLAKDKFLDRKVAVKLLRPHIVNDATLAERFRSLRRKSPRDLLRGHHCWRHRTNYWHTHGCRNYWCCVSHKTVTTNSVFGGDIPDS